MLVFKSESEYLACLCGCVDTFKNLCYAESLFGKNERIGVVDNSVDPETCFTVSGRFVANAFVECCACALKVGCEGVL